MVDFNERNRLISALAENCKIDVSDIREALSESDILRKMNFIEKEWRNILND